MRKKIMRCTLATILVLSGCAGHRINLNYTATSATIPEQEKSKIEVPEAIYQKVTKDISYILDRGFAERIHKDDFDHFHVLLPQNKLSKYKNFDENLMISDPDIVILYHTREEDYDKFSNRNLRSSLTERPEVIIKFADSHTISPSDLECRHITGGSFRLNPNGKYLLNDGRRIEFFK